jgi:hypothetical protein
MAFKGSQNGRGASLKLSKAGIGEMLRADFMVAEMGRRAEVGKLVAEAIAPVYREKDKRGRFKDSFYTRTSTSGGYKKDRAAGYLGNNHPAAFQIETGTIDTPAHRTLRIALEAMARDARVVE